MSQIKVNYDPQADALYIKLAAGEYAFSEEKDGVIIDYDENHNILGIEVLDASKQKEKIGSLLLKFSYEPVSN